MNFSRLIFIPWSFVDACAEMESWKVMRSNGGALMADRLQRAALWLLWWYRMTHSIVFLVDDKLFGGVAIALAVAVRRT